MQTKKWLLIGILAAAAMAPQAGWAQTTPPAAPAMAAPAAPSPAMSPPAPSMPAMTMPMKPGAMMAPININTATVDQLDTIPHIGPKRAAAIIKNRPYSSVNDLLAKKALPKSVFDKIKTHLTV